MNDPGVSWTMSSWVIIALAILVLIAVAIALVTRARRRPAPPVAAPPVAAPQAPPPVAEAPSPIPTQPAPPEPLAAVAAPEPPATPALEPIVIEGRTLSPLQYRYLFPDLSVLPESDDHITRHFVFSGRRELASRERFPRRDRLLAIELQQLSPLAPRAAPSPFWRFVPGETDTLDIICSHAAPEGEFRPTVENTATSSARLYLKYGGHEFFQRGIPGLSGSIDETARWIEAIIARINPRRVRTIGFSAGAYGAILFGHLLSADGIYATGAELALGGSQYPSSRWYPERIYDPAYRDLRPFLPGLRGRIALVYPVYDPIEFRAVQAARRAGIDNLALVADFHPGGAAVPLSTVLQAEEAVLPVARFAGMRHPTPYDDAMVERAAAAYEALADRDFARSEPLLADSVAADGLNHGFMCHLGVHRALRGDVAGAEQVIRAAMEGMLQRYGNLSRSPALHARTLLRSFYQPRREEALVVEPLFERIIRETEATMVGVR